MAADEATVTADFIAFLMAASRRRYPGGQVKRFNQGRAAGCVDAEFAVLDTVPADCRVGLFATPARHRARIRFASATSTSDRQRDSRGMSIKLAEVEGTNLTEGQQAQDFLLISHPVMTVPGPPDFLALLRALDAGGLRLALFFLTHPKAARIAAASRQHPISHLDIPYWSTTPYLFGPGRAVKYIVRPVRPAKDTKPVVTDDYLRTALRERLASSEAVFDFVVQFQSEERSTPIEDASVEWDENRTRNVTVARITIGPQALADPDGDQACESLEFNPWHAVEAHRPLGGFNRARREIYRAMARFRRDSVV